LQNVLKIDEPYQRRSGLWDPDVRTPTRLGEAQIVFRLAREENGAVMPWYPHQEPRRAWALSEVSVRATRLRSAEEDELIKDAKKHWPAWDRDIPVLLLRPDASNRYQGWGFDPHGQRRPVTYDETSGLVFPPSRPTSRNVPMLRGIGETNF